MSAELSLTEFVPGKPHLQLLETPSGLFVQRYPRDIGEQLHVAENGAPEREEWMMTLTDELQQLRDAGVSVPNTRIHASPTSFYFDKEFRPVDTGVVMVSEYIAGLPILEIEPKELTPEQKMHVWRVGNRTVAGLCRYASAAVDQGKPFMHDIFPPKQFMLGRTINSDPDEQPDVFMVDTEGLLSMPHLNILDGTANLIGDTTAVFENLAGRSMPKAKQALRSFKYGDFDDL